LRALAVKLLAQLLDEFSFDPGETLIVQRDGKQALPQPAVAIDLLW